MIYSLLSSKGQITIPRKLQKEYNLSPRSRIVIYAEKDGIKIKPLKTSIVDQTAGSLAKYITKETLGKDWKEIREETQRLAAEHIVKKGP